MNPPKTPEFNRAPDLSNAQELFPRSIQTLTAMYDHAATASMEELEPNPVQGREWMKAHYSLLKKLERTLIPELMEQLKEHEPTIAHAPKDVANYERYQRVIAGSTALKMALGADPAGIVGEHDENGLLRFVKGSIHRTIQLKWFAECLADHRYRPVIMERCGKVRGAFEEARKKRDVMAAQMTISLHEAESYINMTQDYLEKFNLEVPADARLATTTLKNMNTGVYEDVQQHQAYEVADSYTVVKDLTRDPLLVTMGSCSRAPIFGWEGRALGLASMRADMYEHAFRSGEASVQKLKSAKNVSEQLKSMTGATFEQEPDVMKEFEESDEKVGTAMLADSASMPYSITWEGRIKIPESTVGFDELFTAVLKEKDRGEYYAEALRFQLLWYLRALTCRSEMQPKDISPSRVIRTVHKPKQIPSTIRLKTLPREPIQMPKNTSPAPGAGLTPTPITPQVVIEHKRKLPKGFYATPAAVAEAEKYGFNLAQEVQEDGSIRYVETCVRPHKRGAENGDPEKVTTIQACLRQSAAAALKPL